MIIKTKKLGSYNEVTKTYAEQEYSFNSDMIKDVSPIINGCILTLKDEPGIVLISADYTKLTKILQAVEL